MSRGPAVGSPTGPLPDHIIQMVRRSVPRNARVIRGTTPVVSFGNPDSSSVATLGINPSKAEFMVNGRLLPNRQRRLATLTSLGATRPELLSDEQVAVVVDECSSYFRNRPYTKWFGPLDAVLRDALGVSYFDGSACHLDLVQWATDPVWGELSSTRRRLLLDESTPFLRSQLEHLELSLVVVNGAQVWDQLSHTGLVETENVGTMTYGSHGQSCTLRVGEGCGIRFAGWTLNLQSSPGVRKEDKRDLAAWLSSVAPKETSVTKPRSWYLEKEVFRSKSEFTERLRRWFRESLADTIGAGGSYSGTGLLIIELEHGTKAVLNGDTKRDAVAAYLATVDAHGAEHPWRVMANSKGSINKLEFTASGSPTPGWYCYLTPSAEAEHTI